VQGGGWLLHEQGGSVCFSGTLGFSLQVASLFLGWFPRPIIIQGVFMGGQSVRAMAWVAFAHALRSVQRGGGEQGIFDFGDTLICMGKASYC
jgi:hypothetical protein